MVEALRETGTGPTGRDPVGAAPQTPRRIWVGIWACWAVAVACRGPALYDDVRVRLLRSDLPAELDDPHLQSLAVNTGFAAALVLAAFFCLLYLAIGATLDRRLFAPRGRFPRGSRVGLTARVAFWSVVPVQVVLALTGSAAARNQPLLPVYLLVVAAVVVALHRRRHPCSRRDLWLLVTVAAGYALLAMVF